MTSFAVRVSQIRGGSFIREKTGDRRDVSFAADSFLAPFGKRVLAQCGVDVVAGAAPLHVVADAAYSNGEQAAACESKGILPHVPAHRGVNAQPDRLPVSEA